MKKTNEEYQAAARNWSKAGENITATLTRNEERLAKAADTFSDASARLGKAFSDDNQKNLSEAIKNFGAGTANLESVMKNVDELAKDSRQVLQRVDQSFRLFNLVVGNLQTASQPWAERSGSIAKNLDEGAAGLNRMLTDSRQLFRVLGDGEGSLKMLLSDPSLFNHLNDAACMVTPYLPRLDRMLRDMEIFADKVARHPEILSASASSKPSTGLKK